MKRKDNKARSEKGVKREVAAMSEKSSSLICGRQYHLGFRLPKYILRNIEDGIFV